MGSNTSTTGKEPTQDTSQYGQIYLQTDRTGYYPGDTVTGTVFLNLISDYPGNQIFLKFKGTEAVHKIRTETHYDYYYTYSSYKSHYKDSTKNTIIKENVLLHSWERLPPGQFSISFSFRLREDLSSSFYQQGYCYLAFREYQIEAFLKPRYHTDPKMKCKLPFHLKEKILSVPPRLFLTQATPLKTWWCSKQGSIVLKANLEKYIYFPGEKVSGSVELDNSGTLLKNKKIILSLKQKLTLGEPGNVLYLDILKTSQELSGLNTNGGTFDFVLPPLAAESEPQKGKNPSKKNLLNFKENRAGITSTIKSRLITSSFEIEISCPMSGCCATLPKISIPITIVSPEIHLRDLVKTPENWQPLTLESVTLVFPNESHLNVLPKEMNGRMVEAKMIPNLPDLNSRAY